MDDAPTNSEAPIVEKKKVPQTMEEIRAWRAQEESAESAKHDEREAKIDAAYRNLDWRQALAKKQEELRAQMNEPAKEGVSPEIEAARQRAIKEAYDQTDRDFMKANAESEQLARELGVSSDVVDGRNIRR